MTFSIVARDESGSHWGVAVASKFLAAGAVVPSAAAGVGALATQAQANLTYRPEGLRMMAAGINAAEVLAALTSADDGRAMRQAGAVDATGASATFTGDDCMPWAGGVAEPGVAIQGNILTGPEVVDAMLAAWRESSPDLPLARRLQAALVAGDRAGGDARGRQSAALLVVTEGGGYGGGSDVLIDLRVDDHADPVPELARLLDIHDLLFGTASTDDLLPLDGDIAQEVATRLSSLGYVPGDRTLAEALAAWAGVENLEERLVDEFIDPTVLEHLRRMSQG